MNISLKGKSEFIVNEGSSLTIQGPCRFLIMPFSEKDISEKDTEYKKVQKLTNIGYEHLIYPNGAKYWYKDGKLHRLDGPAIINSDGYEYWYKDGKRHREGGPALIYPSGSEAWYKDGKLNRLDGPAYIRPDGYKEWWKDGKLHRLDGPAIIHLDGSEEWWLEDKKYTKVQFNKKQGIKKPRTVRTKRTKGGSK